MMKKTILLTLALLAAGLAFGQEAERHLSAIFSYAIFDDTEGSPYVETYLSFDGNSLNYSLLDNGRAQATIDILLTVRRGDSVVHMKKYNLNSPASQLPEGSGWEECDMPSFLDLQRFALPNGIYTMELSLKDRLSKGGPLEVSEQLLIDFDGTPRISSVQPMAGATKTTSPNILSRGGLDMTPYVSDFYPEQVQSLNFYTEIYHLDKELKGAFAVVAYIEQRETGRKFEDNLFTRRCHTAPTVPVYGTLDISRLPSGNYNLVVEARTKSNDLLLYQRLPFMRSNPQVQDEGISAVAATFAAQITEESLMNYYLAALYPICTPAEDALSDRLAKTPGQMDQKQAFFYNFWRARNPMDPEGEWRQYRDRLDYVDQHFSYPRTRGYLTDRGRVYLQYGPPSHVRDEKNFVANQQRQLLNLQLNPSVTYGIDGNENTTPQGQIFYLPYQLWRYDLLPGDDGARCFLFWDEHRSGMYLLLHSNAKGEVQDPLWERRLSQRLLEEGAVGAVGEQFLRGF